MEQLKEPLTLLLLVTAFPAAAMCAWAGWLVDRRRTRDTTPDDVSRETSPGWCTHHDTPQWCPSPDDCAWADHHLRAAARRYNHTTGDDIP